MTISYYPVAVLAQRESFVNIVLFILGFMILLKSADLLVTGASSLASRSHIPDLAIGLTVVSFGTSLPEVLVSVVSSIDGHTDLAIGNILGSNIANILLVLGIAALIRPLPVKDSTVLSEIPFSLSAVLLVGFLANAALFSQHQLLTISRLDGCILLFSFCLFMLYVYKMATEGSVEFTESLSNQSLNKSVFYIFLGTIGLYIGGQWVVDGAMDIAYLFGASESLIGLTLVAVGTSLPELVASSMAAMKGKTDIAVGNVVGSNIFNMLWVLGVASVINELPFDVISNTDLVMVIFSSTVLILALVINKHNQVSRFSGAVFLLIYAGYLTFLVMRG
jgi:cation:H+ antiporter